MQIWSPIWVAGMNSRIAAASQSCRARGTASREHSKMKPPLTSLELQGRASLVVLSKSKSGIIAMRALACMHLIPHCDKLANGFECCLISSPKFPIVRSRVHWEEQIGGPRQITSCGKCMSEWMHGRMKWIHVARHWQYIISNSCANEVSAKYAWHRLLRVILC